MKNGYTFIPLISAMVLFWICCASDPARPLPENPEHPEPIAVSDCEQCILITEQQEHRIVIVDVKTGQMIWEWTPRESNIAAEHYAWFNNVDEAKSIYNRRYLLITASGGGVAIVRISDKKTLFYDYAGKNPHSAEILPDGNLIAASSTDDRLTLFQVDSTLKPGEGYQKTVYIEDGHNVVWDNKRDLLWATSNDQLKAFSYNGNCGEPDIQELRSVPLPGGGSHELFPVYGEDALWLSQSQHVYKYDLETEDLSLMDTEYQAHIKSISSGPNGFATLLMKPQEEWWSDSVIDTQGNVIYKEKGLRIYKTRWFLPNAFSYPKNDPYKQCE